MDYRSSLCVTVGLWALFTALALLSGLLWALMAWFGDHTGAPVARVLTLLFGLAAALSQAVLTALLAVREIRREGSSFSDGEPL